VEVAIWVVLLLAALGLLGFAAYRYKNRSASKVQAGQANASAATESNTFKVSYAPSDMEWSGSTSGALPLKTLTYKQYECLEDARYGFKIIGATPKERKLEQAPKVRAHGIKTVASLVKHGFLMSDGQEAYVITDRGLNALAVCDVRY
jgi:hypothetical protein